MSEAGTPPPPSFAGRLRVADFMFSRQEDSGGTGEDKPSTGRQVPHRVLRSGRSISTQEDGRGTRSPSSSAAVSQHKRKASRDAAQEDEAGAAQPEQRPKPTPSWTPSPTKKRTLAPPAAVGRRSRSRARKPAQYAPPATYAHLPLLPDAIAPNLLVLFIGLNPGVETARSGHAYAHPSNLFWKLLYKTGVTPVACRPDEDRTLPARFQLGLTNIVARPSRNGAELRPSELDEGVAVLEAKARRWRPEAVCIVGKGIWESIVRVRYRRGKGGNKGPAFRYGWQDESENMGRLDGRADGENGDEELADGVVADPDWNGARVFVASSTSGLAASLSPVQKEAIWRELGEWVEQRREEIKADAAAAKDEGV